MTVRIIVGDVRERLAELPDESVHCVVTSPPYLGLRSYLPIGHPDKVKEIGLEETPSAFVDTMVAVFHEARRVLRADGTMFLNLGDSYAGSWGAQSRGGPPSDSSTLRGNGHVGGGPKIKTLSSVQIAAHPKRTQTGTIREPGLKPKDLIGIPWRVALALQADGWYLRDAIVWAKPNCMPGSQQDRCTSSYEMVFHLSKSESYWSDFDAIKTPPRESSLVRTAQDTQAQAGSHRANGGGKTNGPMKAVGANARTDKQRGHSRRHAGFNDRWDAMERQEQQSRPAMMRNVWFVPPAQFAEAHFAVMPDEIARRCILAGCPQEGTVLDPFGGAGTTSMVADLLGRDAIMIELLETNAEMARKRITGGSPLFAEVAA
jgi:DNA modification methylase